MQKKDIFILHMHAKSTKYRLTVIVPVNNEEGNLPELGVQLLEFIKTALVPTEILFIDDGSVDNSLNIIRDMCNTHLNLNYVSLQKNEGLSAALKVGFDHVQTNLIGYIDADLQTRPEDFNKLLEHIASYDMVIGIRKIRKDSLLKIMSSKTANFIRRLFTRDGISDTGCPLKIIRTNYAKDIPMFKGMHRFLPALVQLQNGSIKQVPVAHYDRINGQSHFNIINRLLGTLIDCFVFLWIRKRYIRYTIKAKSLN